MKWNNEQSRDLCLSLFTFLSFSSLKNPIKSLKTELLQSDYKDNNTSLLTCLTTFLYVFRSIHFMSTIYVKPILSEADLSQIPGPWRSLKILYMIRVFLLLFILNRIY